MGLYPGQLAWGQRDVQRFSHEMRILWYANPGKIHWSLEPQSLA
jgi:hypothetical protein